MQNSVGCLGHTYLLIQKPYYKYPELNNTHCWQKIYISKYLFNGLNKVSLRWQCETCVVPGMVGKQVVHERIRTKKISLTYF